jgi:hypothetical protein
MAPPKKTKPKSSPTFDFPVLNSSARHVAVFGFNPEKGGTRLFMYTKKRCREFLEYYRKKALVIHNIIEQNPAEFEDLTGGKLTLKTARRIFHAVQHLTGTYDDDMAENSAIALVIDMTSIPLSSEIKLLHQSCIKFLKWYTAKGYPDVANYLDGEESE